MFTPNGLYVVNTPFLKVSPRAYYPDYTVLVITCQLIQHTELLGLKLQIAMYKKLLAIIYELTLPADFWDVSFDFSFSFCFSPVASLTTSEMTGIEFLSALDDPFPPDEPFVLGNPFSTIA